MIYDQTYFALLSERQKAVYAPELEKIPEELAEETVRHLHPDFQCGSQAEACGVSLKAFHLGMLLKLLPTFRAQCEALGYPAYIFDNYLKYEWGEWEDEQDSDLQNLEWCSSFLLHKNFHIGRLNYKYSHRGGIPVLGMHIPGSARSGRLTPEAVKESMQEAYRFFGYSATGRKMPITGRSWVLSSSNARLFREGSHILWFRKIFTITKEFDKPDPGAFKLIFGLPAGTPLEQLPRDTSLRSAAAALYEQGGYLNIAEGYVLFDGHSFPEE